MQREKQRERQVTNSTTELHNRSDANLQLPPDQESKAATMGKLDGNSSFTGSPSHKTRRSIFEKGHTIQSPAQFTSPRKKERISDKSHEHDEKPKEEGTFSEIGNAPQEESRSGWTQKQEQQSKALMCPKLSDELPPVERLPKDGESPLDTAVLPEEQKGDELLATNDVSVVRLDVLFSFGLQTCSKNPDFSNYLHAVEVVVRETCERTISLSYDAAYSPYVQQYKIDGTFLLLPPCKARSNGQLTTFFLVGFTYCFRCCFFRVVHPQVRSD